MLFLLMQKISNKKTVAPSDYQKKETSPEPEQKTQKAQKEDWKPLEWSMNQHNGLDQDEVNRLLQQEAEKTAPKPSASNQTDPLPPFRHAERTKGDIL
jgi:hypothetical protein